MEITEWKNGDYIISTEKSKIDVDEVHQFLSHSYWAENVPKNIVQKSIDNSFCFGVYHLEKQVGFARVISDFATFAYLADVFILPNDRGKGLSKWLMQIIIDHPKFRGLRRFTLATRDAHKLYSQFGFTALDAPDRWMQRHNPDIYKKIN
jgi:GNAT superfamily N-acetyltransferase